MNEAKVLIVDDNKSILSALNLLLQGRCKKVKSLSSPNMLLSELQTNSYDVLLLDMNFSAGINTGNEGLYWLGRVKEVDPCLSVVMITAYGDIELAVKAVRQGANDFVLKPWDNERLLATIQSAYKLGQSRKEVKKLKEREKQLVNEFNYSPKNLIGSSTIMKNVSNLVAKVAVTSANVLITGENGTGKELVAREIHRKSERSDKIMVSVDMGAVTESLFESELFGHKKGAFTDAKSERTGKIEMANGGTLFLDEIGNLSLSLQAKLLTVLQNRKVTKVGDNQPVDVDVRLVCATNCDLLQMVADGTFREDLLYRINTIQIEVPPLRERGTDIVELGNFFLKRYASKYNKKELTLAESAKNSLINYHWPGNVRELQHALEKAVILTENDTLTANDFFFQPQPGSITQKTSGTIAQMEETMIKKALDTCDGNLSLAANKLGITRQTLYNKIKKYGL